MALIVLKLVCIYKTFFILKLLFVDQCQLGCLMIAL